MSMLKKSETTNDAKIELFALFVCLGNESICSGKRSKLAVNQNLDINKI